MNQELEIKRLYRLISDDPNNAENRHNIAYLYFLKGDYNLSLMELEKAYNLDPQNYEYNYDLALIYSLNRDWDAAVRQFRSIRDSDGDYQFHKIHHAKRKELVRNAFKLWLDYEEKTGLNSHGYFMLGVGFLALAEPERAQDCFLDLVRTSPTYEYADYHLALCYYINKNYNMAAQQINLQIQKTPDFLQALYLQGRINSVQGRVQQAALSFERIIKIQPGHKKALYNLGVISFMQKNYEKALDYLNRALTAEPNYTNARFYLGSIYEKQFNMVRAIDEYKKVIELDSDYFEAYFNLGMIHKNLGKAKDAIDFFNKAAELHPEDADVFYYLGLSNYQCENYLDACFAFNQSLGINPRHAYVNYSLGLAYYKAGKLDEAALSFMAALEMDPNNTHARNALGWVFNRQENPAKAVEQFREVLKINPSDMYAHYNLGASYFKLGMLDEAIAEYQNASENNPNSAYARFSLGATYSRQGKFDSAIMEFQAASELLPDSGADLALYATLQLLAAIGIEHSKQGRKLADLYSLLDQAYLDTVKSLAHAIDTRDPYTQYHSDRVARFSKILAESMGLSGEECRQIELSGYLHDIGKIGIPDNVLRKPGKLDVDERMIMESHTTVGAKIMEDVHLPWDIIPLIKHHHERYDGKGYPDNLIGEEIPLGAQIISVVDVYDALVSNRPYRDGFPPQVAVDEIIKMRGAHFSDKICDEFLKIVDKIVLEV